MSFSIPASPVLRFLRPFETVHRASGRTKTFQASAFYRGVPGKKQIMKNISLQKKITSIFQGIMTSCCGKIRLDEKQGNGRYRHIS